MKITGLCLGGPLHGQEASFETGRFLYPCTTDGRMHAYQLARYQRGRERVNLWEYDGLNSRAPGHKPIPGTGGGAIEFLKGRTEAPKMQYELSGEVDLPLAEFSPCGLYRYTLRRRWFGGNGDILAWFMLNPSTADAEQDDPTIHRCCQRAKTLGFSGIDVVNLFAYRTPSPKVMMDAAASGVDVIGPDNDRHIAEVCKAAHRVVIAWGGDGPFQGRHREALLLLQGLGIRPLCLGVNADNLSTPRHPLYIPYDYALQPYEAMP